MSVHEEPLKIAIVTAGSAADEDNIETQSLLALGDHTELSKGKVKAIPGYDSMYVPFVVLSSDDGGMYSPGKAGPKSRL